MEKKKLTIFNGLQDLETSHALGKKITYASLGVAVLAIFIACIFTYSIYQTSINNQFAININTGQLYKLTPLQIKDNQRLEAEHHIREFYRYFLNIEPNKESIETNLNKALLLADNSLKNLYFRYKENHFYNDLIQNNIYMQGWIDSLNVNIETHPYNAVIWGKQKLTRGSNSILKTYNSTCNIRNIHVRTDGNVHALIIENFRLTSNKQIENENEN